MGRCRTALGTSVGGPFVREAKAALDHPNEDCAVAVEDGARSLLAVFDGHCGWRASHVAATAIGDLLPPPSLDDLLAALDTGPLSAAQGDFSATTMALAVLDRDRGRAFGLSFGDPSIVRFADGAAALTEQLDDFVTPWGGAGVTDGGARTFEVELRDGDDLALFTDGVDECHRNRRETSVQLADLVALRRSAGATPATFCSGLLQLALAGVRGHPGGQDNVTAVVSRA